MKKLFSYIVSLAIFLNPLGYALAEVSCNDKFGDYVIRGDLNANYVGARLWDLQELKTDMNSGKSCSKEIFQRGHKEMQEYWDSVAKRKGCIDSKGNFAQSSSCGLETYERVISNQAYLKLMKSESTLPANRDCDSGSGNSAISREQMKGLKAAVAATNQMLKPKNMCEGIPQADRVSKSTNVVEAAFEGLGECFSGLIQGFFNEGIIKSVKAIWDMLSDPWGAISSLLDIAKEFVKDPKRTLKQIIKNIGSALYEQYAKKYENFECYSPAKQSKLICSSMGQGAAVVVEILLGAKFFKMGSQLFKAVKTKLSAPKSEVISSKPKTSGPALEKKGRVIEGEYEVVDEAAAITNNAPKQLPSPDKAKSVSDSKIDVASKSEVDADSSSKPLTSNVEKTSASAVNQAKSQSVSISAAEGEKLLSSAKFLGPDQKTFLNTAKKLDLQPKETVQIGKTKISVGDVFDIGHGRTATIAVVESAGEVSTRVFYSSNSQGTFRLLPGKTTSGWFSKGVGESSLNAPRELQQILAQRISQNGIRKDVPANLYESAMPVYKNAYMAQIAAAEDTNLNVGSIKVINENGKKVYSKSKEHDSPENVKISLKEQNPHFEKGPVSSYETSTGAAGKVKVSVFKSADDSLEYTFYEDSSGRAWVASVSKIDAPINAAGIRTQSVDAGDMTMPRFEYHEQIPDNYKGNGRFGPRGEYGDAWPYLKKMKIIQDYYKAKGLPVPP